ncbi:MAG: 3'-5' exonuclease [Campylobacterales bacterium]|nr:3'-5' exonuclease [Campylobacterales bacterium]
MFARFFKERNKKKLRDPQFSFLFDTPSSADEFVVFDTETTGLDPKKDEILSIGAVKIKGNKILAQETLSLLLRPSRDIAVKSITIHQLRNIDMVGALAPKDALVQFLEFVGPLPLVGYYLEFDVAMVNRYLQPWLGIKLPNTQIEVSGIYHDKKIKAIPDGIIDLRFDTIMRELGLPVFGKHDAVNDAIMTAMMFVKLQNIQRL